MSVYGTDFQLLQCTKSRRDPGTADMSDGLSGLNSGLMTHCGHPAMQAVVRSISHNQSQVLDRRDQSALMLAARITLPHFSVSSAISFPKSPGEPDRTVIPRSAN